MMQVALLVDLSARQTDRLRAGLGDADLLADGDISQAEIVFGNPDPQAIAGATNLRWVQLESVGFGEYLHLDWTCLSRQLTLTNLAGFFATPVAETALAGLLALSRRVDELVLLQKEQTWVGDPIRTRCRRLTGSHVVMVGYGAINQRLAKLWSSTLARFARTGDPNGGDLPRWPTYDEATRACLVIDQDPHIENDPDGPEWRAAYRMDS